MKSKKWTSVELIKKIQEITDIEGDVEVVICDQVSGTDNFSVYYENGVLHIDME